MPVNEQYNVAHAGSLPERVSAYQRRKIFKAFLAEMATSVENSVLDVGVTSERTYEHSNYFEAWYRWKDRVIAVGVQDASFLEETYKGVKFVAADGHNLPFQDGSFDYVHSSAVLEHVGSFAMQVRFLSELWRVSRKGIFVTTPNRWFPIEFHTMLPLLHWLPMRFYRRFLAALGYRFFAEEENLNLLSRGSLTRAARLAGIASGRIATVSLFGVPTNLLLVARKL